MANIAVVRAKREYTKCQALKNFEIVIDSLDGKTNLLAWDVVYTPCPAWVVPLPKSPSGLFSKTYTLQVLIPEDYPFHAPKINFVNPVFHPNIDRKGEMCIPQLTAWLPSYTIESILNTLHSRFIEPDLDNPINIEATEMWKNDIEGYRRKVNS